MRKISINTLQFCEPFYTIKTLHNEKEYRVGKESIVINLSDSTVKVKDKRLNYLKSTIVTNITIEDLQRAIIVEDYEKNTDHAKLFEEIKEQWSMMYDMTKQERHKGILLWRSPKEKIFGNTEINLCYIAANVSTGPHKTHTSNFTEVHTQLLGLGKMQKFEENDCSTLYQEVILAPGNTHDPFCNEHVEYPWHQYRSVTDAIYMPIEIC